MSDFLGVLIYGLLLGGVYGLVGLGVNLVFGVVRILNFAQGELIMVSMYAAYFCSTTLGIDPYLTVVLVVPAMFLFGALIQRSIMQRLQNEPMMQMFATFGLLMVLQNVVLAATHGVALNTTSPLASKVWIADGLRFSVPRLLIFAATTLITFGLHLFLHRTMPGKAVRALTQDRRAARVVGINVERVYVITFGVGAALTGLAGVLLAPLYTLSPGIGQDFIFAAFAVVVLGGLGSVWGAYIGGLVIGLAEAFAGFYIDSALKTAVWFTLFIVVLIVRPSGLLGQPGAAEMGARG